MANHLSSITLIKVAELAFCRCTLLSYICSCPSTSRSFFGDKKWSATALPLTSYIGNVLVIRLNNSWEQRRSVFNTKLFLCIIKFLNLLLFATTCWNRSLLHPLFSIQGEVLTSIGFISGAPTISVHGFNIYYRNRLILVSLPLPLCLLSLRMVNRHK
jgi:hypothetical protein